MKTLLVALTIIAIITLALIPLWFGPATDVHADVVKGEELSVYMDHMRRQTHKLELSIDAKNKDLATFYAREVGETVELIKTKFPEYDGLQIAALANAMIPPYLGPLSTAIDGGDWAGAGTAFNNLLTGGCNGCHTATQRAYIKIVSNKTNPYNQSFKP